MYGSVLDEDERALEHLRRRDPVRDVDDARVGRDARDHAVARADEVVLQPEVGEEADHHGVESTAPRARSERRRRGRRGRSSPPRRAPRRPPRAAARVVSGPIETAGARDPSAAVRPGGRRRGEHDEVAVRPRVGRELHGPVEHDDVGAEGVRQQPPGALGTREEHAARLGAAARRGALPASRSPRRGRRRRTPRPWPARSRRPVRGVPRHPPSQLARADGARERRPSRSRRRRPARRRAARSRRAGRGARRGRARAAARRAHAPARPAA